VSTTSTTDRRPDRVPVHREDGELVGFVVPQDGGWTPCAVFGPPVGEPTEQDAAEQWLRDHGLSYLAARWLLREGDDWIRVDLVEAAPDRVVVAVADYGRIDEWGRRTELAAPVDGRLRLA